jgi:class 3 adenylate cyclase
VPNREQSIIEHRAIVDFVLGHQEPPPPPAPAAQPQSGTRTVLFTDLVGHTEMMQRLGDAKGRDVLREHERITRETLNVHGGAEVKTMGDGFMASFGSVTRAVDCAIALQRAFAARGEKGGEPLSVRVGLNAGEPIEEDGDLFGATVILASRIAARAGAGEILVPDTVRGLLSGKGYMFGDRGEFVPKGFDEGVRLWDVRWRE